MNIRTTIVCLPVQNSDKTLTFYKNVFGLPNIGIDEGIIILELPNLSLFLMEKTAFESYTKKTGRSAQFPTGNAGVVVSCAMTSKEDIDSTLAKASNFGGTVPIQATVDKPSGGYTGYFCDPDGYLWELVYPIEN